MNNPIIVILEILLVIVCPLIVLYLRGKWPMRTTIPSLIIIPVLWYLTYSPLHELSHVLGAYLAGGKVVYVKLIPSFWRGEFGRAWITPEGLHSEWQQFLMTASPYIIDAMCIATGYLVLRKRTTLKPFLLGLLFMLLCLRPTFDCICETIAFAQGQKGDLFCLAMQAGNHTIWLFMTISTALSALAIANILRNVEKVSA